MASVKTRIGPADHGRSMSLEEFGEAESQPGYRYELARGIIEVVEVPDDPHAQVVDNLHEEFTTYRRHQPGQIRRIVHASDVQLIIPEWESERHPDLAIIFREATPNERGRLMPWLAVEVVSPGKAARDRDYLAKREEYLTFGIREYWIVDPLLRFVMVLKRRESPDGPAWSERVFRDEEAIESDLLPGLETTVSRLWADTDEPA